MNKSGIFRALNIIANQFGMRVVDSNNTNDSSNDRNHYSGRNNYSDRINYGERNNRYSEEQRFHLEMQKAENNDAVKVEKREKKESRKPRKEVEKVPESERKYAYDFSGNGIEESVASPDNASFNVDGMPVKERTCLFRYIQKLCYTTLEGYSWKLYYDRDNKTIELLKEKV